jgi:hypothetical protein
VVGCPAVVAATFVDVSSPLSCPDDHASLGTAGIELVLFYFPRVVVPFIYYWWWNDSESARCSNRKGCRKRLESERSLCCQKKTKEEENKEEAKQYNVSQ